MKNIKPKSTIKTPGFIFDDDDYNNFRFDFKSFYKLGAKVQKIPFKKKSYFSPNSMSVSGLCFRSQVDVYRDSFYLTDTEDIKFPDIPPQSQSQSELSQEDFENVNKQIIDLIKQLKKNNFQTSLIEISLFDPSNPESSTFYTFIYAPSKKIVQSYLKETRINALKGPILPDSNLYDFPLLHLDSSDSFAAPVLDDSQERYLFVANQGIYKDVDKKKKEKKYLTTGKTVRDFVEDFFTRVQNNILKEAKQNNIDKSIFLKINSINTAMLIPFLRPAGVLEERKSQKKDDRLRGGGVFLYGCFDCELTEKDQSLNKMVLWLKNKANLEIMNQSHTAADVAVEKFKSRAAILHYIPYTFSESIKQLIKYEKSHPDFHIPTSLYIVAVETALHAGGYDKDALKKFIFRLPVADTLKEKGLGAEVFEELSNERGISRLLAEYSLATHSSPIFSKQLKKPEVVVEGYLPFEKLRLNDDIKIQVFIALLIVILKESIEHTERYINNNYSPDDEDYRKVRVLIKDNSITIKNPAPADAGWSSAEENGTQLEAINLFKQYLSREWECQIYHKNEKGWWARVLSFSSRSCKGCASL